MPLHAWALARAWPGAELTLVDHAGHGAGQDPIGDLVVQATDRFAQTC